MPIRLLELLEGNPIVNIDFVYEQLSISRTTAARLVDDFERLGILQRRDAGKQRYRVYLYESYLTILQKRFFAQASIRLDQARRKVAPILTAVLGLEVAERRQPMGMDGARELRVPIALVQELRQPVGRLSLHFGVVPRIQHQLN